MDATVTSVAARRPVFSPPWGATRNDEIVRASLRRRIARSIRARRSAILSAWWTTQFDEGRLARYQVAGAHEQSREAMMEQFLAPLLDLLVAYLQTGDERYRDVYLDERLRFAPHLAPAAERASFFEEILAADEDAVVGELEEDHEAEPVLRSLLAGLHAPLRTGIEGAPTRIIAVGDCLMNEVRVFLARRCRELAIPVDFHILYFSALVGRTYSTEEVLRALREQPADLLAFSFLSYDGIPPYSMLLREADRIGPRELSDRIVGITGLIREYLGQLRGHTEAPFLLHNAGGLPLTRFRGRLPFLPPLSRGRVRAVRALNEAIGELAEHVPNTILIDEEAIVRSYGHRACAREVLPPRIGRGAMFHTAHFGGHLVSSYTDIVQSYRALRKAKVLLVDFDNTLWDGIMADGAVTQRHDLQRLLRKVKDAGMLLVATSKNDPANIRWAEMSLTPDDFVLHKINWNPKVQSIREVAHELDLGLDSFVFIDDNPVERELVQRELPMVVTLDPADPATERWIERLLRFPNTRETAEARQRTELYRQRAKRREALSQTVDYPAMMRSLALEVRFGAAAPGDLGRISELIQRTNQFNTTTIRYSTQELRGFLADDTRRIYVAELSDKFGSVGLVAVAIVERRGDSCTFDSFVMSCRAMGFELERLMLGLVIAEEDRDGAMRYVGRVIPTARNTPALSLYSANGFTACGETEWVLEPDAPRPASPAWFTVRERRRGRLPQAALVPG